jgi:hypothetical protein
MKKYVFGILALVGVFSLLIAATPTDRTTDANTVLLNSWYETLTPSKLKLTGSGDTSILAYRWAPKWPGSDVILARSVVRAAKGDSVGAILTVECLDKSYNTIYNYAIDTITTAVGEAFRLPIGSILVGSYFTIRLITGVPSTAANTHQTGSDSVSAIWNVYYPTTIMRKDASH